MWKVDGQPVFATAEDVKRRHQGSPSVRIYRLGVGWQGWPMCLDNILEKAMVEESRRKNGR